MTDNNHKSDVADATTTPDPIALTADIVAAYVSNNSVPASELVGMIAGVHRAIVEIASGAGTQLAAEATEKFTPAQVRKSITPDALISFIDGKPYKTLKRHLGVHGLDPQAYRTRFGLPSDYPMVAPSYSEKRSVLARTIGLGRYGGRARSEAPGEEVAPQQKRRGPKAA